LAAAAASAALVVLVAPEAQLPVPAEPLVPASQEPELPALAPPALAPPALARLPVLAHLVVEPAGPVEQLLLSRQSFSAARARSSP